MPLASYKGISCTNKILRPLLDNAANAGNVGG